MSSGVWPPTWNFGHSRLEERTCPVVPLDGDHIATLPGRRRAFRFAPTADNGMTLGEPVQKLDKAPCSPIVCCTFELLSAKVAATIRETVEESLDLIRTYYYDCLPHQTASPTLRD